MSANSISQIQFLMFISILKQHLIIKTKLSNPTSENSKIFSMATDSAKGRIYVCVLQDKTTTKETYRPWEVSARSKPTWGQPQLHTTEGPLEHLTSYKASFSEINNFINYKTCTPQKNEFGKLKYLELGCSVVDVLIHIERLTNASSTVQIIGNFSHLFFKSLTKLTDFHLNFIRRRFWENLHPDRNQRVIGQQLP